MEREHSGEAETSGLTTPEGVVSLMRSCKTYNEWVTNADSVKEANGGEYPSFWFDEIVRSGLMAEKQKEIMQ